MGQQRTDKEYQNLVAPPFWRSDLAYLTYLILTGVLGTGLYLFIKKRQYEKSLILSERMEKKKMEEVNTLKLNFFTNISHELRTPLSLILIPLHLFLKKNVFSPEIRPKEISYQQCNENEYTIRRTNALQQG